MDRRRWMLVVALLVIGAIACALVVRRDSTEKRAASIAVDGSSDRKVNAMAMRRVLELEKGHAALAARVAALEAALELNAAVAAGPSPHAVQSGDNGAGTPPDESSAAASGLAQELLARATRPPSGYVFRGYEETVGRLKLLDRETGIELAPDEETTRISAELVELIQAKQREEAAILEGLIARASPVFGSLEEVRAYRDEHLQGRGRIEGSGESYVIVDHGVVMRDPKVCELRERIERVAEAHGVGYRLAWESHGEVPAAASASSAARK